MKIGTNKRSVSVTGKVTGSSSSIQNSFKSSQELKNVEADFNAQLNGTAVVPGGLTATASAMQMSQLSSTALALKGQLTTATHTTPTGEGSQNSLAVSIFEVAFTLDAKTNFVLKGERSFFSHDNTLTKADFVLSSSSGKKWATLSDLNGTDQPLTLPVGKYKIMFNTQVGAQTDPLGDLGVFNYSFSLIES